MSDDLRAELEAAFAESNGKGEEVDNAATIDALDPPEEKLDEGDAGADKADEQSEPEQAPAAEDAPATDTKSEPESTWDHNKAPSSWSPKVREQWASLPEEVRKEVIRREEASVNGVRKLQEEFEPIRKFAGQLDPYIQEARSLGTDAGEYIARTMAAERSLRSNDPKERFNALLNIADTYGVPLRQALGGNPVPTQGQSAQLPPEVVRELQEAREYREQAQRQTLEQQVNSFKEGKEFFEDVRELMAGLLDAGTAKDLQDAYDKAVWIQPEVREVMLARQAAGTKKEELKQRQTNAGSASVKSSGAADVDVDLDDEDDSTEAIVRKAIREQQNGRI